MIPAITGAACGHQHSALLEQHGVWCQLVLHKDAARAARPVAVLSIGATALATALRVPFRSSSAAPQGYDRRTLGEALEHARQQLCIS